MIHLITYDLKAPNDTLANYEVLIQGIKSEFGTWCHLEQSVWLIDTERDAGSVRDILKQYVDDGDVLFVARLRGNWASRNLGAKRGQWLKGRAF
jgi:hypothetical protein